MVNKVVYTIHEDNHGLIGIADSKAAAFSFLVRNHWLTADTPCGYSWDDDRTLAEICKAEGITEENFIDWAIFRLENFDFWENSGFYIYTQELYTEKAI